jgi:hypothetical protein
MVNKAYEVVIETITTRVLVVSANNKGFAQIRAKAGAGEVVETSIRTSVKSVNEKELAS